MIPSIRDTAVRCQGSRRRENTHFTDAGRTAHFDRVVYQRRRGDVPHRALALDEPTERPPSGLDSRSNAKSVVMWTSGKP